MRIAVWYNLPNGGAKRALYHQMCGLVERGHYVESWCTPRSQDGYLPISDIVKKEHLIPVRNWTLPFSRWTHHIEEHRRYSALDQHCIRSACEINKGGFDVFLGNSCADLVVSQIGRYITIPKVLYLPEPRRWLYEAVLDGDEKKTISHKNHITSLGSTLLRQAQRDDEYKSASAYDMILVNSLYSRESLLRAYGLDSRVCYLGVDTDLFRPREKKRDNYIVGLGEIDFRKGVDRAIRAIATIDKHERPDLIWIGNRASHDYQVNVSQLAHSLDVNFIPKLMLSDQELVTTISGALAMIYTSRLEPFGFAPIEAAACGTPVVAIAEGGVRETVIDQVNGLMVCDDNPIALGEAITCLSRDLSFTEALGKKGRELVLEKWTWSKSIQRLENMLESVLH